MKKEIENLPIVCKTYNYFDDGKIKESRKMEVVITEIVPFDQIDQFTLDIWEMEVKQCPWLYSENTDYFIKADLKLSDGTIEKIVFVRITNGWFSMGWWSGRLGIDGLLTDSLDLI